MRYDTYMNQCLIMFDHASFFCATLLAIVLNWVLFFLALLKASNFVKLCIFFCVVLKAFMEATIYFYGMEGALFCKAMWIFFWCWKWFSHKLCHYFCDGKVIVSYKLCGFFLLHWVHHGDMLISLPLSYSIIVVAYFFHIHCIFFFAFSSFVNIFLLFITLHFHQPPIDWFLFNTILDIHMVGGFSLFFHAGVGDGCFSNHFCTSQNKLRNLLLHH